MRNIGSKLFLFLIAALIVAGLGYAFMPRPVEVDLVKVDRGNVQVTVDEDGKTRIREKYVVSAPLNGRILRIGLDPGDEVEAGKTLLTMIEPRDPELLDARAVAQAEARVKAAEATLKQIEPKFAETSAAQELAETNAARMRKAFQGKGISEAELDEAEYNLRQKGEALRSMKMSEEIARFELEQAQAALLRSRPQTDQPAPIRPASALLNDLGDPPRGNGEPASAGVNDSNAWNFPVYSPINGRVLRVMQESSSVVTPGTPLVEVGDSTDLEVEIDVLSRDAAQIHPGDLVLLEHWGGGPPLKGRVRVVEPSGFTKISTLGVEEQRVWVIVDLVQPPEERPTLGDGFRVEARVVIDEAQNALRVPTSALFRAGEEHAVFSVKEGVVHKQPVKVGRQNGLEAEILTGLAEGDQIVLHPSDQIDEGVKVKQR